MNKFISIILFRHGSYQRCLKLDEHNSINSLCTYKSFACHYKYAFAQQPHRKLWQMNKVRRRKRVREREKGRGTTATNERRADERWRRSKNANKRTSEGKTKIHCLKPENIHILFAVVDEHHFNIFNHLDEGSLCACVSGCCAESPLGCVCVPLCVLYQVIQCCGSNFVAPFG